MAVPPHYCSLPTTIATVQGRHAERPWGSEIPGAGQRKFINGVAGRRRRPAALNRSQKAEIYSGTRRRPRDGPRDGRRAQGRRSEQGKPAAASALQAGPETTSARTRPRQCRRSRVSPRAAPAAPVTSYGGPRDIHIEEAMKRPQKGHAASSRAITTSARPPDANALKATSATTPWRSSTRRHAREAAVALAKNRRAAADDSISRSYAQTTCFGDCYDMDMAAARATLAPVVLHVGSAGRVRSPGRDNLHPTTRRPRAPANHPSRADNDASAKARRMTLTTTEGTTTTADRRLRSADHHTDARRAASSTRPCSMNVGTSSHRRKKIR